LLTDEGIQEAAFSSPGNNVFITFLGTSELLECPGVSGAQPDAGKLESAASVPAASLWNSRCALPHGRAPGGTFVCQRSCLMLLEGL